MKSDSGIERPYAFNIWRECFSLKCAECKSFWHEPNFSRDDTSFNVGRPDWGDLLPDVYCPACGAKFASMREMLASEHAFLSPTHGRYFAGTGKRIKAFLEETQGYTTSLWDYRISHSCMTFTMYSKETKGEAYVVCMCVTDFCLPSKSWNSTSLNVHRKETSFISSFRYLLRGLGRCAIVSIWTSGCLGRHRSAIFPNAS